MIAWISIRVEKLRLFSKRVVDPRNKGNHSTNVRVKHNAGPSNLEWLSFFVLRPKRLYFISKLS
jgi:hypothetical protein